MLETVFISTISNPFYLAGILNEGGSEVSSAAQRLFGLLTITSSNLPLALNYLACLRLTPVKCNAFAKDYAAAYD
ncbi:hypothetical protein BCL90_0387 [Pedobacter alluvionis]|nr:hypothetical protein BCL90_0387 [Pedobacter alluvionis]